jgi:hypothetical protein
VLFIRFKPSFSLLIKIYLIFKSKGNQYINSNGKEIKSKEFIGVNNCCQSKCCESISIEKQEKSFESFL